MQSTIFITITKFCSFSACIQAVSKIGLEVSIGEIVLLVTILIYLLPESIVSWPLSYSNVQNFLKTLVRESKLAFID